MDCLYVLHIIKNTEPRNVNVIKNEHFKAKTKQNL